jgi:hypothetical protein
LYLPVRPIFEQAGRNVYWGRGRLYITREYRPCPINTSGEQNEGKLTGIIYHDSIFVTVAGLAELGIKVEKKFGGVRLVNHGGKWLTIETGRGRGDDILIELAAGDKSPPRRMAAPASGLADGEYVIPLRKVLTEFGYIVLWNSAEKTASVAPVAVSGRF